MKFKRAAFALAVTGAILMTASSGKAQDLGLKPRTLVKKTPTALLTMPPDATGRLVVKFNDDVKARLTPSNRFASLGNKNVVDINQLIDDLGLTITPAFSVPQSKLTEIETRAASKSGFVQPDLGGIYHISGPKGSLQAAARALNEMNTEWVEIESKLYPHYIPGATGACCIGAVDCQILSEPDCDTAGGYYQGDGTLCVAVTCLHGACCLAGGGLGDCDDGLTVEQCIALGSSTFFPGADCVDDLIDDVCRIRVCCLPDETCVLLREDQCDANAGNFDPDGTTCEDVECDNDCGQPTVGNCWDPNNGSAFCDDQICCNFVCTYDPFCCDEENFGFWDAFCVAEANVLCNPHTPNWLFEEDYDDVNMNGEYDLGEPYDDANGNMMWDGPEGTIEDPPLGPDRCASPLNGNCFEAHGQGGCNNQLCCNIVCAEFAFCCESFWSNFCVEAARTMCIPDDIPPDQPTPDFTDIQGYLTRAGYAGGMIPPELLPFVPNIGGIPFLGFGGQGFDFFRAGEDFDDFGYDGVDDTDDVGEGNGWRDPPEPFDDYGADGEPDTFDAGEGNFVWDAGEPFEDLSGDGNWSDGETFSDDNGDFIWTPPLGLTGIAQQLLYDDGVDATGDGILTGGKGAKIGVVEWAFYPEHEDLRHMNIERGQTLVLTEGAGTAPNHATACLSIINARDEALDGQPRSGVTGIVPEAEGWFFPITSLEEGPRSLSAWLSAIAEMGEGDVLSASYGPGFPFYNINNVPSTNAIFRVARDLGIMVCVSAGNDCANLDTAVDSGDSGAIVVGACSPGLPHYRLAFSNYYTTPDPQMLRSNIVHAKAWGTAVVAAGYGILWYQEAGTVNRAYTPVFGGTSAASPQVAGTLVALQGLARQFYGLPFSPEVMRRAIGAPGPVPNPPSRFLVNGGFPEGQLCNYDLDPDAGPNLCGVYPDPAATAATILSQDSAGFGDAPLIDDVVIVRGDRIRGNKWSIKGDDNMYLEIEAIFTDRNTQPGPGGLGGIGGGNVASINVPEVQSIRYLSSGDITDIVVVAHSNIPDVNTLIVENQVRWPNVFAIEFVEAYNWRANRWTFVDLIVDGAGATTVDPINGDMTFEHTASAPSRFVRETDDRVLIRLWTLGFPTIASFGGQAEIGDDIYRMRTDLVNLFLSEESGVGLP